MVNTQFLNSSVRVKLDEACEGVSRNSVFFYFPTPVRDKQLRVAVGYCLVTSMSAKSPRLEAHYLYPYGCENKA